MKKIMILFVFVMMFSSFVFAASMEDLVQEARESYYEGDIERTQKILQEIRAMGGVKSPELRAIIEDLNRKIENYYSESGETPPQGFQEPASKTGTNWEAIGVITAIVLAIGGWLITRRKKGKTSKLMKEIDNAYGFLSENFFTLFLCLIALSNSILLFRINDI